MGLCSGANSQDMRRGSDIRKYFKGKKNIYTCTAGHSTVTVDIDDGVTPFMITCQEDGCDRTATSMFYRCDQDLEPTHEWYKPDKDAEMTQGERDHVEQGGLLLRKID